MTQSARSLLLLLLVAVAAMPTGAHEIRPAYLSLTETAPGHFAVIWKVPTRGDAVLSLQAVLPDACGQQTPTRQRVVPGALLSEWTVLCAVPLAGTTIAIAGLQATLTDALLRIDDLEGGSISARLTPGQPAYTVPTAPSSFEVIRTYLLLGVEHILLGVDHLLFVFALLLIVSGRRRLVVTITAFTIAHSITLAAATLGYVHLPQAPVEAVIALSILFLATEIIHNRQGRPGLAARSPWMVAFVFGLLHGLGFAGALSQVGLPERAIPLALLFFNLGVEIGQLLFIAAVFLLAWCGRRLPQLLQPERAELLATYCIGGMAAYWTIQRVAGF